jgi:pSer/pThr/pTyr-binding forkhead associated (FHA) protein
VPILRDFERRLGGLVEGFFATTFRSGLQPVELAKRIMREMEAGRTVGVQEMWAPNRFVFSLSEVDGQRFEQAEQALVSELKQVVRETASERGWGLVGPPEIEFEVDPDLGKGRFVCAASFVEGPDELPSQPTDVRGTLVTSNGNSVSLTKAETTLGRLPECDVVVDDPGVSRQHARIRRAETGFVLSDLGSTNGTFVNEQPVQDHLLADGDRITIGETLLVFRGG